MLMHVNCWNYGVEKLKQKVIMSLNEKWVRSLTIGLTFISSIFSETPIYYHHDDWKAPFDITLELQFLDLKDISRP